MKSSADIAILFERGIVWSGETAQRAQPATAPAPLATFDRLEIDCELAAGGLPFGALHEWLVAPQSDGLLYPPALLLAGLTMRGITDMVKKRAAVLPFQKYLIWIGRECWPSPFLVESALRVGHHSLLGSCLFIDPPNEKLKLWAFDAALRSPAVAAATLYAPALHPAISRRLAYAAKSGAALGFVVSDLSRAYTASMAETRWAVTPQPIESVDEAGFVLELLKQKGRFSRNNRWEVGCSLGARTSGPEVRAPRESHVSEEGNDAGSAAPLSLRLLSRVVGRTGAESDTKRAVA